jgi:hypothetical protein
VRAWVRDQLKDPNITPLRASLLKTWSEAYVAGGMSAVEGGRLPQALTSISDWNAWKAGNGDAAELLDAGGWKQLLDAADVTVKSIADTSLDRVGTLLADGASSGASVDEISGSIRDFLDNPERADMIASTELARATELASMDSYAANGITRWDWILSPDACRSCTEQAGANPHSIGDVSPPLHPNCECASAPVDSTGGEGTPSDSLGD